MTNYLFVPNSVSPFQFQPTLDGQVYTGTVTWNLMGQRWYLNINEITGGALVFSKPMVGSSVGIATADVSWDQLRQRVVVTTAAPHGRRVGGVYAMTLSGVAPAAYNGLYDMVAESSTQFSYPMTTDPGDSATVQGSVVHDINLAEQYFDVSTVVYREATGVIEVNP